jgi:hypothetical protein
LWLKTAEIKKTSYQVYSLSQQKLKDAREWEKAVNTEFRIQIQEAEFCVVNHSTIVLFPSKPKRCPERKKSLNNHDSGLRIIRYLGAQAPVVYYDL